MSCVLGDRWQAGFWLRKMSRGFGLVCPCTTEDSANVRPVLEGGKRERHVVVVRWRTTSCRSASHLVARRWSSLVKGVREGQVETAVQKKHTLTLYTDSISTLSSLLAKRNIHTPRKSLYVLDIK